ncbi:DUF2235 domain-containing protein [Alkalimonas sp. MEB108]|uniref:DUF2235 domain-containing protein n=1 Tax=Alkalimonas cellulosilytica TaxID=3058395 RepID=A0ABU7J8X5_9GAMM|nr:DUF2235 domain-containing protein [Alkalimonas sp. MEB108]MEE2003001.1 DUF2235 domain-containing protein [Alkalimonas sp. MEB108]
MTSKRIILCCDGTWNEPQENPTNIVKIARAIQPKAEDGRHQVVFYDQGVGTFGRVDRFFGGAFGMGVARNVLRAYRFLVHNYQPGDEIYCFGFSRGAYTARAVVGMVHALGLVSKQQLHQLGEAYRYYRSAPEQRATQWLNNPYQHNYRPTIRMAGVFDTVGALGVPVLALNHWGRSRIGFFDTHLSPLVKHAYHALALDEKREPFAPDLWTGDILPDQQVEQCWFAGVHSDIGGGYPRTGLSDTCLEWMLEKARALGLSFDEFYLEQQLRTAPMQREHNSYTWPYRLLALLNNGVYIRRIYGRSNEAAMGVRVHSSVYQRIESGYYQPQNPDLPASLKDYLASLPDGAPDTAVKVAANDGSERRQYPRLAAKAEADSARLYLSTEAFECQVLDYSEQGGVRLRCSKAMHPGTRLQLAFEKTGLRQAVCVWQRGDESGIRFAA